MNIENRLKELNIQLPAVPKPVASYVPFVKTGSLVFISGVGPIINGEKKYPGKIGKDLSKEEGYEAARLAILNSLAILEDAAGGLDNVARIVSLQGFVNSTDDFHEQPFVINGASDLLVQVFGEKGKHSRFALSSNSLPMNICVEIILVAEVK